MRIFHILVKLVCPYPQLIWRFVNSLPNPSWSSPLFPLISYTLWDALCDELWIIYKLSLSLNLTSFFFLLFFLWYCLPQASLLIIFHEILAQSWFLGSFFLLSFNIHCSFTKENHHFFVMLPRILCNDLLKSFAWHNMSNV